MKTNHNRSFSAPSRKADSTKGFLKAEASRGLRRANHAALATIRTGYCTADEVLYGTVDEVSNPWNWN